MELCYAAATRRGLHRPANEDRVMAAGRFLAAGTLRGSCREPFLAVVCDGVGGAPGGARAAETAGLSFLPLAGRPLSPGDIAAAVDRAGETLRALQRGGGRWRQMSTTLAGLYWAGGELIAFNVGDSRVYGVQEGRLVQLSRDHTEAQRLVDAGVLSHPGAAPEDARRTLARYLGGSPVQSRPTIRRDPAWSGGPVLLCSDGVYRALDREELESVLTGEGDAAVRCRRLMELAAARGAGDDLSVVVAQRAPDAL